VSHLVEPRPLLTGGKLDVGLCPLAWPLVLLAVEGGRPEPVLPGEGMRIPDPKSPLLGRVHEEKPTKRPPGLSAQRLLRLLIDQDDLAAVVGKFSGGDQASQATTHHDHVGVQHWAGDQVVLLPLSSARRSLRSTFPIMVFGRSSRSSIAQGTLKRARFARQCSNSSAGVIDAPGCSTTKA
jgi:hypothetical protein